MRCFDVRYGKVLFILSFGGGWVLHMRTVRFSVYERRSSNTLSYTHLALPALYTVYLTVVAVSLEHKDNSI